MIYTSLAYSCGLGDIRQRSGCIPLDTEDLCSLFADLVDLQSASLTEAIELVEFRSPRVHSVVPFQPVGQKARRPERQRPYSLERPDREERGVPCQADEKRDLLRCTSSCLPVRPTQTGVIAAYCRCASFLRIRPPSVSSFCSSLLEMAFSNGLLWERREYPVRMKDVPGSAPVETRPAGWFVFWAKNNMLSM